MNYNKLLHVAAFILFLNPINGFSGELIKHNSPSQQNMSNPVITNHGADEFYNGKFNPLPQHNKINVPPQKISNQYSNLLPGFLSCKSIAALPPEEYGSMSGRVTDPNGVGIYFVFVYLSYQCDYLSSMSGDFTDASGNYTIDDIPTGIYKVSFDGSYAGYITEWYNDKEDFSTADAVTVTAPNTTSDINAILTKGGSISGRVTDSNGAGIEDVSVRVYNQDKDSIARDYTDSDGNYTVQAIPTDSYRVEFDGSSSGYLTEWYNDKAIFSTADTVSVTAPNTTPDINAVLRKNGSISGKVTDSNGVGIYFVSVSVYDLNQEIITYSYTDFSGNYTIQALSTGSYKVEFDGSSSGYLTEWYNDKAIFSTADTVSVTAPNTTPDINAVLTLGGSISGKVTDSNGVGIKSVSVSVYDLNQKITTYSYTDASGNYTARGLSTGTYKVEFNGGSSSGYLTEWYNDKAIFSTADTVSVTAPSTTPDINAVLTLGGSISGTVKSSNDKWLGYVWVTVYDLDRNWISSAYTDACGNYTVTGIPTGSYKIEFDGGSKDYAIEWYNDKENFSDADQIAVTAPNTTAEINAVLTGGGSISGRVTDSNGAGIEDVVVTVFDMKQNEISSATTDVSGSYTTQGIAPGSYKIKFDGSDEGYDTEWYNGKKDFNNANIITVIASNTTTEINSVLGKSTKSYSISGMVTGAVKKDVTITLSGNSSGTTTTDLMGNYSFSGLTNGTYTITPSKSGYTFTPANKTVTVDGSNFTGQNFTATASGQGYSISGKVVVTDTNAPLPDVTITLSGSASATTSTDSTGNYSFSMLPRGIYKITPLKTGYTFSPKNKWVIVNRANVTNKDFKAKGK